MKILIRFLIWNLALLAVIVASFVLLLEAFIIPAQEELLRQRAKSTLEVLRTTCPLLTPAEAQLLVEAHRRVDPLVSYVLIVDRSGKAWAHSTPSRVGMVFDDPGTLAASREGRAVEQLYTRDAAYSRSPYHGERVVDILQPYYDSQGRLVGAVNIGLSLRGLDQFHAEAYRFLLVIGLFLLVAFSLISFAFYASIIRPIRVLKAEIGIIAENPAAVRLPRGGSSDEIGELTNSFEAMAARINVLLLEAHRREQVLSTVLNSLPAFTYLKDTNRRYIMANRTMCEALGLSLGEVVGKTDEAIFPPASAARSLRQDSDVLSTGLALIDLEEEREVQGRSVLLSLRKVPIHDPDGKITGLVGMDLDISDKRKAERERAILQDALRQAKKLESVGRLAGGVAHDFNNLLSPILGFSELTLMLLSPDHPAYAQVVDILEAGRRARDLTRQLLAFSRRQVLDMRATDLRGVVTNFERILRRTIREDIRIDYRLADSVPWVQADVGQVEEILMNMAVNAQDAMPDGGTLTVSVTQGDYVSLPDGSDSAIRPPIPCVVLGISDTGQGISADVVEHIFEPFFTTKEVGKGTGLGLASVFGVVQQHSGFVTVESVIGKGSLFQIYFPQAAGAAPICASDASLKGSDDVLVKGHGETILVAEDNEAVVRLVEAVLLVLGYRPLITRSAQECLEVAAKEIGVVDLLLSDVIMPGANGRELYERLRQIRPGLKVLFMSGYSADTISRYGVLEDGIPFIHKPFTTSSLAMKISQILAVQNPAAPSDFYVI